MASATLISAFVRGHWLSVSLRASCRRLASGTRPFGLSLADQGTGERREGEGKVGASLVTDGEAAEASQPHQSALHVLGVATEALAALDAAPSDPR